MKAPSVREAGPDLEGLLVAMWNDTKLKEIELDGYNVVNGKIKEVRFQINNIGSSNKYSINLGAAGVSTWNMWDYRIDAHLMKMVRSFGFKGVESDSNDTGISMVKVFS